ncbi:MAG: hypothetical protein ACYSX0_16690 [Planctomycetota bacterium]|jgi:hypothetical protein
MTALATLLLLAAPFSTREPVGQGAWDKETEPVARRVSSVLAGAPIRRGFLTVVPLHARVPSEARMAEGGPGFAGPSLEGGEVSKGKHGYLRLRNEGPRPLLVLAGSVFVGPDAREVFLARDGVVPAGFAALFPARVNDAFPSARAERDMECLGMLPPLATGLLLHGQERFKAAVLQRWVQVLREESYVELARSSGAASLWQAMRSHCRPLASDSNSTAVGAVFLLGGRPVAAHLFATHRLFAKALPDLLMGFAIQARDLHLRYGPTPATAYAQLSKVAASADEQAKAVNWLRGLIAARGRQSESYGEGSEQLILSDKSRTVGHAVLDHRRVVIHLGYYALGSHWPGARPNGDLPPRPGRPGPGGSEASPGEIDRKARPSLAEARQRARRPGPSGRMPGR